MGKDWVISFWLFLNLHLLIINLLTRAVQKNTVLKNAVPKNAVLKRAARIADLSKTA